MDLDERGGPYQGLFQVDGPVPPCRGSGAYIWAFSEIFGNLRDAEEWGMVLCPGTL